MTVDRAEVTVLVRPLVPYGNSVILEILDVGISCNEPQKFMDNRLEMHLLGSEKRKTFAEVETHLIAEDALRSGTGAIRLHCSVFTDMSQQI